MHRCNNTKRDSTNALIPNVVRLLFNGIFVKVIPIKKVLKVKKQKSLLHDITRI